MKHVVLAAMFAVGLSSNALLAAEPDRLGQAMLRPPGAATLPVQAKLDSFNLDSFNLDSVGIDGVSGSTVLKFLSKQYGDRQTIASRGRHDAEVYKAISPSVVIVVTDKAIGSGSYIGNDQILTNWHVVQGFQKVGLYFKPGTEGAKPGERDFQVAEVVHYDPQLDLALLKAVGSPGTELEFAL